MSTLLQHEKAHWSHFTTHGPEVCVDNYCPVHNPSNHHMRKWPLNYRQDRGITERICPCGVGHPDPDCYLAKRDGGVHGCCGCCQSRGNRGGK